MSLQIISSSPTLDAAIQTKNNTLFVEASTDQPPLSYQWYGGTLGNVILQGETRSTYSPPVTSNLAGIIKVHITDNLNRVVEREFEYNGLSMWKDGVNPKTQVVTVDKLPVVTTNRVRGSLHNYDNIYELSYAQDNFERIIYGQIAFVKYDIPAVSLETKEAQHQTLIRKYYKCNVKEPYVRDAYFRNVTEQQWKDGSLNAKYWVPDNSGTGSGATAVPIMNNSGYVTGIRVITPGEGYEADETTVIGVSTDEDVQLRALNPQVGDVDYDDTQGILSIITTGIIGPFTTPPAIVIISGGKTTLLPPKPIFQWTVGDSEAYDWQEVTFLNAEPDNDTIIVEDGLVKANIPKPYNSVTLSLTAQSLTVPNGGFVNTVLLNEVSTTITIKNIHVYADNFENICANTLGASSITLSVITSDGTQSIMSSLGSITKSSLSQGFGDLSVTIDKTGLNQNHTITIIAAATEVGSDNARTHVVTVSTQIQWCYNKYYLKDSNSTVSNTITIPNSAGKELSFVPQGSYVFPYTTTPQYLWVLLPTHMNVNRIGKPDENVPFYSDASNNLITTNITIVRNGQSQPYKGYRSYWPTAADYTVTI